MNKKKTIIIGSIVAVVIIGLIIFCAARCGKKSDSSKDATTATKYIEVTDKSGKVIETKKVIFKGENGEETVIVQDNNDSFDSGDGDSIDSLVGDNKSDDSNSKSNSKKTNKNSKSSSKKKSDNGSVATKAVETKKSSGGSSDEKKKDEKTETTKKKDDDKKPETTKKHQSNFDVKDKDDDQGFGKLVG